VREADGGADDCPDTGAEDTAAKLGELSIFPACFVRRRANQYTDRGAPNTSEDYVADYVSRCVSGGMHDESFGLCLGSNRGARTDGNSARERWLLREHRRRREACAE
jgi:hypothetical protein